MRVRARPSGGAGGQRLPLWTKCGSRRSEDLAAPPRPKRALSGNRQGRPLPCPDRSRSWDRSPLGRRRASWTARTAAGSRSRVHAAPERRSVARTSRRSAGWAFRTPRTPGPQHRPATTGERDLACSADVRAQTTRSARSPTTAEITPALKAHPGDAASTLADAAAAGIELGSVTAELEREGAQPLCATPIISYSTASRASPRSSPLGSGPAQPAPSGIARRNESVAVRWAAATHRVSHHPGVGQRLRPVRAL